jgi:hypothetical protein
MLQPKNGYVNNVKTHVACLYSTPKLAYNVAIEYCPIKFNVVFQFTSNSMK